MWKYIKLALGVLLMCLSVPGLTGMSSDAMVKVSNRIAENGVDAVGVIEKRTKHIVAGRVGRIGGVGTYYSIKYSFKTSDGHKFSKEINVSGEQAHALADGQEIRVRYYAMQPSINAALDFQEYMTAEEHRDLPVGAIIFSSVPILVLGGWLSWSSWHKIWLSNIPRHNAKSVDLRVQSMGHSRANQTNSMQPKNPARSNRQQGFGQR